MAKSIMPKILLVEEDKCEDACEDNADNRDMLSRCLERKGYEVILAVDGGDEVMKALSEKPDLIRAFPRQLPSCWTADCSCSAKSLSG